jgi:hypothetical protein
MWCALRITIYEGWVASGCGPHFCEHPQLLPKTLRPSLMFQMQHSSLLSSSVGRQMMSEPSKEKLRVCSELWILWLYNGFLFRYKTSSRLYVLDFARAKRYSKRSYGLSHRVAVAKKWHKLSQNEPWRSLVSFLTRWREQKKRLNSSMIYSSLNSMASSCLRDSTVLTKVLGPCVISTCLYNQRPSGICYFAYCVQRICGFATFLLIGSWEGSLNHSRYCINASDDFHPLSDGVLQQTVKKPPVLCAGSLSSAIQEDHLGIVCFTPLYHYRFWNCIQSSQQDGALAKIVPPNNSSANNARYSNLLGSTLFHLRSAAVQFLIMLTIPLWTMGPFTLPIILWSNKFKFRVRNHISWLLQKY